MTTISTSPNLLISLYYLYRQLASLKEQYKLGQRTDFPFEAYGHPKYKAGFSLLQEV